MGCFLHANNGQSEQLLCRGANVWNCACPFCRNTLTRIFVFEIIEK